MSSLTAVTIINCAICAAITVGIWVTGSALPLFGLLALVSWNQK